MACVAVRTQAAVYVYVNGKSDSRNDSNAFVAVVQGLQASATSLVAGDFTKAGETLTNPIEGSNRLDITGIPVGAYARWDLNAAGLNWVSKTGWTKLGLREGHDLVNAWPAYTVNTGNYISVDLSEQLGQAQDPFIEISYVRTGAATLSDRMKTLPTEVPEPRWPLEPVETDETTTP